MAKRWVLDTETKGTGANVVPLEPGSAPPPRERERKRDEIVVGRKPRPRPEPEPAPRQPPRFKVVDVMTARTLAEDADGRTLVDVLKGMGSPVDVRISRWDDERGVWRLLTAPEQRAVWALRDR